MSYQFRVLPPEEYYRLGLAEQYLPIGGIVGVVEDGDRIAGRWLAGQTTILEGLEIHPDYRKHPGVARALFAGMMRALTDAGVPAALTIVQTGDVVKLALHAEFEFIPGVIFQKDLR